VAVVAAWAASRADFPTESATGCPATPKAVPQPQSLGQLFDRIVARTDVPRIRFHDLRHTHVSLLIASGEAIKVVSERLGHAHPAFTTHTYQHLIPGLSAAAADRFAALIATATRWVSTG
jgi:integrase